jgi:hypothetical protein
VAGRLFTVQEANEALSTVRPLAEEMVRRRRALRELEEAQDELAATAAGNGHGFDPRSAQARMDAVRAEQAALADCVATIQAAGIQVKDLDTGLLDFPAERDGEPILLCWRVGEPEVAWWHTREDGFAGRKPLAD